MLAMLFRGWLLVLFFMVTPQVIAQQIPAENFKGTEDSIAIWFKQISQVNDDQSKLELSNKIVNKFSLTLNDPASFSYSFDSLRFMGRLYAPDHSFRLITWNLTFLDGTQKYFGFIQVLNAATNEVKVFKLIDKSGDINNPESSVLSAGKWYGALYYKILVNKTENRTYYTLLALHYHNLFISRKLIDILFFDNRGNPVFGAPVIQSENMRTKHRLVFEYSARVSMSLNYDEKLKTIVFDHLAPSDSKYAGMYDYYGPDMSFDGLVFKNGRWIWISNLDVRRQENPSKIKRVKPSKFSR